MNGRTERPAGQGTFTLRGLGLLGAAVAASGVLLVLLLDGVRAAGAVVTLLAVATLVVARYVAAASYPATPTRAPSGPPCRARPPASAAPSTRR
ncbi:hypothetical protein ACWEDZ_28050 [Streptomyces sp. NPDC005047]